MGSDNFFSGFFGENNWEVVHEATREARKDKRVGTGDLPLHTRTQNYFHVAFSDSIYRHQHEGLRRHLEGADVALCTGTASGKSAVFYAAGIEALARDKQVRILALYPLKALGREQERRRASALKAAEQAWSAASTETWSRRKGYAS